MQVRYLLAFDGIRQPTSHFLHGLEVQLLIQIGGSRSDLFAITSYVPCATFQLSTLY